jgi:hypothetical protein
MKYSAFPQHCSEKISFFLLFLTFALSFHNKALNGKCYLGRTFSMVGTLDNVVAQDELKKVSQMLSFIEPTTGVIVKLVGAMHYNPTSVSLAYSTCNDLAEKAMLGSVIVESCPQRWNKVRQLIMLFVSCTNALYIMKYTCTMKEDYDIFYD